MGAEKRESLLPESFAIDGDRYDLDVAGFGGSAHIGKVRVDNRTMNDLDQRHQSAQADSHHFVHWYGNVLPPLGRCYGCDSVSVLVSELMLLGLMGAQRLT
jgi:hypothetical protein